MTFKLTNKLHLHYSLSFDLSSRLPSFTFTLQSPAHSNVDLGGDAVTNQSISEDSSQSLNSSKPPDNSCQGENLCSCDDLCQRSLQQVPIMCDLCICLCIHVVLNMKGAL